MKSFKDLKQNSFDEINKYLEKILFKENKWVQLTFKVN